jgi:hypothetical protein
MSDERQNTLTTKGEPEFSKDTIKRIRKLRWAGMDDEVERLLRDLKPRPADVEAEAVLPTRLETD